MKKAIVLLSGGLDSATTLYLAQQKGFQCRCLIFDYGQQHKREIESAKKIAQSLRSPYQVIKIELPWKGSALLDNKINIPKRKNTGTQEHKDEIPSTYVPARNIIFLSFALSYAETTKAETIFVGANAIDFSGYPDCRPQFYRAFKKIIAAGTKAGVEKKKIKILTPLLRKTKAEIVLTGKKLGVPFALTWSCYRGRKRPCGECDSCYFRAKGFREAKIIDPLINK